MIVPYARFYENKSRKYVEGRRYRLGNPSHPCYDFYKQHGMNKTLNHMKITGGNYTNHSSSRKGDFAEYYAVTWLWDHGYEVFQNSGCSGPVDMIAMKDNKIILIDVKTFHKRPDQPSSMIKGTGLMPSNKRTTKQKELGVRILGFNPVTRELRFMEHKDG